MGANWPTLMVSLYRGPDLTSRCRETEKIVVPSHFPCLKCLSIRFEPLAGSRFLVSRQQLISNSQDRKFIKLNQEKTKATLDVDKVKLDVLYDGFFVLTSNTRLSNVQVVERYEDLWQIENGFRQLKSEFQMGPIYHWKDRLIPLKLWERLLA